MAERRATPRARVTISCLESEWERIREVAESRGESINDHVISAGLNVELGPAQTDAPALALSEAEQRRLLDRVDRLAVVRRRRLTPRNRSESKCYHADRRPICMLLSNSCLSS